MFSSSILARLWAIGSMCALLVASTVSAAPRHPDSVNVMPGTLIPLYASGQDAFTRVPAPSQRPQTANAATFAITFSGSWNPQAQAAFQYAADLWEPLINSAVPIAITANWTPLSPGVLGSAGPDSFYRDWNSGASPPQANTWYPAPLANALSGTDLNGSSAEIVANFSSSFPNWYFGTDGNTPAGQYDFVSIVLHEIGHGLGFVGSATVSGGQGSWGQGTGFPFSYDRRPENTAGTSIINTGTFPNPSTALRDVLQSNALFFDGPAAVAANGGARPRLYAPATWQQGSSYSHLDESSYPAGNPNSLMTPQIGTAETIHDPGAITLGVFRDIGWTTNNPTTASIEVALTVGLNSQTCATTDSVTVAPGTRVFYCYAVTNTGTATLTSHTLTDDRLGTVLNNFPYTLAPQASAFITQTAIINQTTLSTATWTATNSGGDTASDTDTTLVTIIAPTIELTLTVGLNSQTCATTDSVAVAPGTRVFYCYAVTNTGPATLTSHTLTDNRLGTVLNNFPYTLAPQASAFITQTTIISQSTLSTATWTATNSGGATASDTDTALVIVTTSQIYLPLIRNSASNLQAIHSPPPISARPLSQSTGQTTNIDRLDRSQELLDAPPINRILLP